MSFESLIAASQRQLTALEALAAVAARLTAHVDGVRLDPAVESAIDRLLAAMGFDAAELAAVDEARCRALAGLIRSFFRQAGDLIENPGRPAAWAYDDPVILESQGRASMALATIIGQVAGSLGDLALRLQRPAACFLDVGTGVGWLAVALAEQYPLLRVVGIDTWRPALERAAAHTAALGDRIVLREQDVTELRDSEAFDCVFLPGPFLPRVVVPPALERVHRALRPGGWLLFGLYASAADPLAEPAVALRIVRSGGHPWSNDELLSLLRSKGFEEVRGLERSWQMPMTFVAGRR